MLPEVIQRIGMIDWIALGLAVAAAIAFLVKMVIAGQVVELQKQATQQQNQIASANVLGQVNNQLIRMLVEAAASSNDKAISGLLEQNGIRFDVRSNPSGTAVAPAATANP